MRIKILLFIFTAGILLPAISPILAQEQLQQPQTVKEAKELGDNILSALPDALKDVWETEALPVFVNMWNWTKNIWETQLGLWFNDLKEQLFSIIGKEIEQKRPLIEQEFQREKKQLTQEIIDKIPGNGKTLWEHIKGFLPGND